MEDESKNLIPVPDLDPAFRFYGAGTDLPLVAMATELSIPSYAH